MKITLERGIIAALNHNYRYTVRAYLDYNARRVVYHTYASGNEWHNSTPARPLLCIARRDGWPDEPRITRADLLRCAREEYAAYAAYDAERTGTCESVEVPF